jgi:hypothetical protein
MLKSLVHIQPLELRLLSAGDNIDVVSAVQAIIKTLNRKVLSGG